MKFGVKALFGMDIWLQYREDGQGWERGNYVKPVNAGGIEPGSRQGFFYLVVVANPCSVNSMKLKTLNPVPSSIEYNQ